MGYISTCNQPVAGCVLCDLGTHEPGPDSLVLHRGERAFVVMNRYPYVSGHLMVVPYAHCGAPTRLDPADWTAAHDLVRPAVRVLEAEYRPQGFNIGMNVGRAAGAGIDEHLHIHIVPRWSGDTNFVPVLSDTRVIPEALEVTWQRLSRAFAALDKEDLLR
jgi:ATP adenylyltransferase